MGNFAVGHWRNRKLAREHRQRRNLPVDITNLWFLAERHRVDYFIHFSVSRREKAEEMSKLPSSSTSSFHRLFERRQLRFPPRPSWPPPCAQPWTGTSAPVQRRWLLGLHRPPCTCHSGRQPPARTAARGPADWGRPWGHPSGRWSWTWAAWCWQASPSSRPICRTGMLATRWPCPPWSRGRRARPGGRTWSTACSRWPPSGAWPWTLRLPALGGAWAGHHERAAPAFSVRGAGLVRELYDLEPVHAGDVQPPQAAHELRLDVSSVEQVELAPMLQPGPAPVHAQGQKTAPSTTGDRLFAECQVVCRVFFFGHSAKTSLPSVFFDTRQRGSLLSIFLTLGKEPLYRVLFFFTLSKENFKAYFEAVN